MEREREINTKVNKRLIKNIVKDLLEKSKITIKKENIEITLNNIRQLTHSNKKAKSNSQMEELKTVPRDKDRA